MTEAAKRNSSPDDNSSNEIASDDPLFELSRIIGFGDDEAAASSADIDPQIDLEDALLAELSAEPAQPEFVPEPELPQEAGSSLDAVELLATDTFGAPEAPEFDVPEDEAAPEIEPEPEIIAISPDETPVEEVSPTPESLEDELAAMLGGEVTVVSEAPEYAEEFATDFGDPTVSAESASDQHIEQPVEFDVSMDEELETVQFQEAVNEAELPVAEPIAINPEVFADDVSSDEAVTGDVSASDDQASLEESSFELETAHEPEEISEEAIDDDFTAFFEDELPKIDVLAESVQEVEATGDTPDLAPAPVLETTDMSAFQATDTVAIDVPDMAEFENSFAEAFDEGLDADLVGSTDDSSGNWAGAGAIAAGAAIGAGASSAAMRVGKTAMANDEETFDEGRFEAELARDIEFVGHDLNTDSDLDEFSSETGFDDQEFAAAAAANRPAKRGVVIAAILGCVAIAGAVGVFAFSGDQQGSADGPVLIKADSEPVKVAPADPGGKQVPNQDRAVFNETAAAPVQEALVSTSEEPVDIAAVPESALPSSLSGQDAQKSEDRLAPTVEDSSQNASSPLVVTPRRVRTLVVKPDGTLVEREIIPTPEPIAPVVVPDAGVATALTPASTTPTTPATAGTAPAVAETVATEALAAATETAAATAPAIATPPVVATTEPTTPVSGNAPATTDPSIQVPATVVPTRTVTTRTATPGQIAERPNDQPVNIVNPEATQVAAAPAAAAPAAATTTAPAAASAFSVQLASLPSEAEAQRSATSLSRRFSRAIGGRGLSIRRAEIDGRGTFYRVRVGATSRAEANQICGAVKSSGGDCFVTR